MGKMPTFLVIGAARSGTTALYTYLQQHPAVFMSPRKETNFFAFEGEALACKGPGSDYINNSISQLADYHALFEDASPGQAIGEASPLYLWAEQGPARIRNHIPDAKLIAILRNPIEQAFSHFLYAKRQTLEPLDDFAQALDAQPERKAEGWQPLFQYDRFPQYGVQLKRYFAHFPADQIRIYLYEDFSEDPLSVLADIYSFIGVDSNFVADVGYRPNVGGVPRSRLLQDFVMKPHLLNRLVGSVLPEELKRRIRDAISNRNMKRPELPPATLDRLRSLMHPDIEELQGLIGRDLSSWLE